LDWVVVGYIWTKTKTRGPNENEKKKTSASATPIIATAAAAEMIEVDESSTYSNLLFRLKCASMLLQSERGRLKRSLSWASLCAVVKTAQQEGGWST
jgi:hypothetical protein